MVEVSSGKLRITYTGGGGPLGSEAAYGPPRSIAALVLAHAAAPIASIVTTPWTRNEHGALAGVKSISYAENVRALRIPVAKRQATEAIFLNTAGHVCEGTGSNIFLVFADKDHHTAAQLRPAGGHHPRVDHGVELGARSVTSLLMR